MNTKHVSRVQLKAGDRGEVVAAFATFGVVDLDGDVTLPGAFEDGAHVRISAFGHASWGHALPAGRGRIRVRGSQAEMHGTFFMDTQHGAETFRTLRALAEAPDLTEWSYGFDILDSAPGDHQGRRVRFLKKLKVHEVSPVLLGAGIGTGTPSIKCTDCAGKGTADPNTLARGEFERFIAPERAARAEAKRIHAEFVRNCRLAEQHADFEAITNHRYVETSWVRPERLETAKAATLVAAFELGVPEPELRWFWQPAKVSLYGRASAKLRAIFVNRDLDEREAALTAAHEVAHVAGYDEEQARAYEREFGDRYLN